MSRSLCFLVCACLLTACFGSTPEPDSSATKAPPVTPSVPKTPEVPISDEFGGKTAEALKKLGDNIAFYQKKSEADPTSTLPLENIAQAFMARARLTGSYEDWGKADEAIKAAFAASPEGGGPFKTRAHLDFALHRFEDAESALNTFSKRLLLQNQDLAKIEAMRAELAFQRGQIAEARAGFDRAYELHPAPETYVQMAQIAINTGELSDARRLLDRAVEGTKGASKLHAWTMLHRGIVELDTGHYEEAKAWFTRANETFSGWFLIEEHLAEVTGILGDNKTALQMYKGIVARVPAGEFMEALADTHEALGNLEEAKTWRTKAGETYRADMKKYPQAVYGHGMDYFLAGDDVQEAVRIAQANHKLRPGFGAKVRLAQAYIRAGKLTQSRELVDTCLQGGWRTADLHGTASILATLQGDEARAKSQRDLAIALHKDVMESLDWLKPAR